MEYIFKLNNKVSINSSRKKNLDGGEVLETVIGRKSGLSLGSGRELVKGEEVKQCFQVKQKGKCREADLLPKTQIFAAILPRASRRPPNHSGAIDKRG